ncbi:alpha/beta hydrolase family protein [Bordetella genomosp. 13]|uniref:Alpha/beta hydrolase n=1 Tax=Bordetella genomosp. 13 TaxID=463040 RepID=A0A1W6ZAG4_9BORD|nr:alpha/beta fold hydrolase [Bordetella genomosp. 13]ARP94150.1 alpha/beta hydrolase [Bordetella genomosp. 13]
MAAQSEEIRIPVDNQELDGTLLAPAAKIPGVLFVHGWGGSQRFDLKRARGVAGLGCVCLTFDLRGHGATEAQQKEVSPEDNLKDVLQAYERLVAYPEVDPSAIAVVGSSYGGYLAAILTAMRPVRWLALHVPALYQDDTWGLPKAGFDRGRLQAFRQGPVLPSDNRALSACEAFRGDVLVVEAEHDDFIPHATIMSYRNAFMAARSMTHRRLDGADHGLTDKTAQQAYTSILNGWITEMVIGARVGGHES